MSNTPASYKLNVGTKAQVFHGTAGRTAGGLKKNDLMKTDKGRIVSKKAHAAGLVAIKRLRNAGYVAKKGEFKLFAKQASNKKASSKNAEKPRRVMTRRVMTTANHQKAHNRALKGWDTRRAKKVVVGGKSKKNRNTRRFF